MNDAEKLSLAYQLMNQDSATYPDVATALVQVELDAQTLLPPTPSPTDVIGSRRLVLPSGGVESVEIMGDGTERAVVA